MFVRVVANAGSGSGSDDDQDQRRTAIEQAFEAVGADCRIDFVEGEQLEQAISDAAEAAPDAVVIAGGDGSLGTAAKVLADAGVPLGVLPSGTFNHFAKDLSIPLDLEEAAALIAQGEIRKIDIAEVNGRCFVNNSSLGLYPMMVALRDRIAAERGWGKVRTVPMACWRVLRRFPARRMTISAAGYEQTLRTPFVFVGNNGYDIGPGGIGRRESITGGELSVYVSRATSRLRLVLLALATLVRGARTKGDLDGHSAPEITINAGTHRLRVAIDGEVVTMRAPLHYRVRPGGLSVIVPQASGLPGGEAPTDASGADAEPD